MSDLGQPGRRYEVRGNVEAMYVDEGETVLVNKKGIADLSELEIAEERCLLQAYEILLSEVRLDTPMTVELILHVHDVIFSPLYEWAGRWRTVKISKPGVAWPPPDYLEQAMREFEKTILKAYPPTAIQTDDDLAIALGQIQGEFLAIHPFREGNARTVKCVTNLLSVQTGRPLLVYDQSEMGQASYIEAARAGIRRDYRPMAEIIRSSLKRARSSS